MASTKSTIFCCLAAALLLLTPSSATIQCSASVNGACADPSGCHHENSWDAATSRQRTECLTCLSASSIAWEGENRNPQPRCIYNKTLLGVACDSAWIAYTLGSRTTTAACYDQCKGTGIKYNSCGNPVGCA